MNINELHKIFIENAQRVETVVKVVKNNGRDLISCIAEIIRCSHKVLLSFENHSNNELQKCIRETIKIIDNPNDVQIELAEFAITDAFVAVARTASICISISNKMASTYSSFAQNHIAILDYDDIVFRPEEIFTNFKYKSFTSQGNIMFISGSSATADMGPLVRGVHGPSKLFVIFMK